MASRKQIRANRRNARKSTGPRSEAGKAASSANALSHGLTAARTVVLPEEEPEAFERLRQGVVADLAPAGALQQALAQRIAGLLWRLDRVARLEAELFAHGRLAKRPRLARPVGNAVPRLARPGRASRRQGAGAAGQARRDEAADRHGDADGGAVGTGAGGVGRRARAPTTSSRATRRRCSARWTGRWRRSTACARRRSRRPRPRLCRRPHRPIRTRHPPATARPPASQRSAVPAGGALHGGEEVILQNEANSAQRP